MTTNTNTERVTADTTGVNTEFAGWTDSLARIDEWMNDGTNNLADGVDAQASFLGVTAFTAALSGHKDYLGRAMRAKFAALFTPGSRWVVTAGPAELAEVVVPYGPGGLETEALVQVVELTYPSVLVRRLTSDTTWFVRPEHLSATPYTDAEPEVESEQVALARRAARQRSEHEQDIALIGEVLLREAQDRGWCDEFDTVVADLNDRLHIALPIRVREFTVRWTETYTVTVHRESTFEAKDGDQAWDLVEAGEADTTDLLDAVRNGSWEYDDCDLDEVTEA